MVEASNNNHSSSAEKNRDGQPGNGASASEQPSRSAAGGRANVSKRRKGNLGLNQNQFDDWDVGSDYTCERLLGTGSYGKVALAVKKSTG